MRAARETILISGVPGDIMVSWEHLVSKCSHCGIVVGLSQAIMAAEYCQPLWLKSVTRQSSSTSSYTTSPVARGPVFLSRLLNEVARVPLILSSSSPLLLEDLED